MSHGPGDEGLSMRPGCPSRRTECCIRRGAPFRRGRLSKTPQDWRRGRLGKRYVSGRDIGMESGRGGRESTRHETWHLWLLIARFSSATRCSGTGAAIRPPGTWMLLADCRQSTAQELACLALGRDPCFWALLGCSFFGSFFLLLFPGLDFLPVPLSPPRPRQ